MPHDEPKQSKSEKLVEKVSARKAEKKPEPEVEVEPEADDSDLDVFNDAPETPADGATDDMFGA
jgi:hypothetical protein